DHSPQFVVFVVRFARNGALRRNQHQRPRGNGRERLHSRHFHITPRSPAVVISARPAPATQLINMRSDIPQDGKSASFTSLLERAICGGGGRRGPPNRLEHRSSLHYKHLRRRGGRGKCARVFGWPPRSRRW